MKSTINQKAKYENASLAEGFRSSKHKYEGSCIGLDDLPLADDWKSGSGEEIWSHETIS